MKGLERMRRRGNDIGNGMNIRIGVSNGPERSGHGLSYEVLFFKVQSLSSDDSAYWQCRLIGVENGRTGYLPSMLHTCKPGVMISSRVSTPTGCHRPPKSPELQMADSLHCTKLNWKPQNAELVFKFPFLRIWGPK